ncbi:thiamine pyrophosphate-dependent enzyme [Nonomuraea glycinis]|uniref:thiamine pyrophosphate-dependent enzyme n=1 Tax=Nonomuraea glycinis TaxID=2047744 RepID=UPI0033B99F1C
MHHRGSWHPEADFSAWARSCGGFGAKVTESGDAAGAIAQALTHDGPALVDVDVDPNEPPMPGKVSYDQAKSFAQAFLKGQPHKAAIATTLFKDPIQKLGDQPFTAMPQHANIRSKNEDRLSERSACASISL